MPCQGDMPEGHYSGDCELHCFCDTGCDRLDLRPDTLLHRLKAANAEAHKDFTCMHPWSRYSSQYCHYDPHALSEVLQYGQVPKGLPV